MPIRLKGVDLGLSIRIRYGVVSTKSGRRGTWLVDLCAYTFTLSDGNDREILAYHWHPETSVEDGRRVLGPHLHVRGNCRLRKAHPPTGGVGIGAVIRLAIEMGARPLRGDWQAVLEEMS